MATTLTPQEIENLQKQLKEKTEEIKDIYDKLVDAGAVPLLDDFLDEIAGGKLTSAIPLPKERSITPFRPNY